jgi:dTDP-4-amino-4,6-dideoxygalactose transaminase
MFIPAFPGLSAFDVARPARARRFPFDAPQAQTFYRARSAIYHLFLHLRARGRAASVLMPDYHSGNELLAVRAAGVRVHFCPVNGGMQLDPAEVERQCDLHRPDVLYVIHYLGWPQPMTALVELCRRLGLILVEDCALALESSVGDRRLGSFGDYAVFCLYKTLPVPNGALLVQNQADADGTVIATPTLRRANRLSTLARTAELFVSHIRSRSAPVGGAVHAVKHWCGRMTAGLERAPVGDIGFSVANADLAMSALSARIVSGCDHDDIKEKRVNNFGWLSEALSPHVGPIFQSGADGVCPLFFPILVRDKSRAARALRQRGIEALEFWNDAVDPREEGAHARFFRAHVLALPVHQDLTRRHLEYIAEHVLALKLG